MNVRFWTAAVLGLAVYINPEAALIGVAVALLGHQLTIRLRGN